MGRLVGIGILATVLVAVVGVLALLGVTLESFLVYMGGILIILVPVLLIGAGVFWYERGKKVRAIATWFLVGGVLPVVISVLGGGPWWAVHSLIVLTLGIGLTGLLLCSLVVIALGLIIGGKDV